MKLFIPNPKTEKAKQNLFFIGILAIICIVLWIGVEVYAAFNRETTDKELEKLLTPLTPTLDIQVLEQYQTSRITPPTPFQISVSTKQGRESVESRLNPFTNTTTAVIPSTSSSSSTVASNSGSLNQ